MERGVDVSDILRALLRERGWRQEDLAEATGISRSTINGYCTGRLGLGGLNAQKVADAFGITLAELGQPEPAGWRQRLEADVQALSQALEQALEANRLLEERVATVEKTLADREVRLLGTATTTTRESRTAQRPQTR